MKEFFEQCLKDLECLTGLRQLYFLETDEDGPRKLEVTVRGMVMASEAYPYIPEEDQKKIIMKMIVEDQTFQHLDSRVIHKWLGGKKDLYWERHEDKREQQEVKPCDPEKVDFYANEFKKVLQQMEVRTQRQPVEERFGRGVSHEYVQSKKKFVVDGIEILADSQEQAYEIYTANHL